MTHTLSSARPDLAAQWHPTKNGDKTPDDVTVGSGFKAWWVCPVDGYEWETRVMVRTRSSSAACPLCSGKRTVPGVNDLATKYPDVAAAWDHSKNGPIPNDLSGSSPKKFWWVCPEGHEWESNVRNRVHAKSGCPVCTGVKTVAGVNDLASRHPNVAAQWHPTKNGSLTASQVVPGSEREIWWQCDVGHEWKATPAGRTRQGAGKCPVCNNQLVIPGVNDLFTTHPQAQAEWSPHNTVDPITVSSGSALKVWWKCPLDGHEWEVPVRARFGSGPVNGCPACSGSQRIVGVNDLATTHPELARELFDPSLATSLGAGSGKVKWRCDQGHVWEAPVRGRASNGNGCTRCTGKVATPGLNDLATLRPDVAAEWHPDNLKSVTEVRPGSSYRAKWLCGKDSTHEWSTSVGNRTRSNSGCPHCSMGMRVSKGENEVADYVMSLLGEDSVERNIRGILHGSKMEFDIWVPSLNVAIEYNGTYYHSTAFNSDQKKHWRKWQSCVAQGITLIQVWEDTWAERRQAVEEMLAAKLGVRTDRRVFARNTRTIMMDSSSVKDFLDMHHIQGAVAGTWHYTLRDAEGVVAVLVAKHISDNTVDITRYATSCSVVGGFSKLLAALIRDLPDEVTRIITYADREVSAGAMYFTTGFMVDAEVAPTHKYLRPGASVREHRLSYRKKRFKTDPSLIYVDGMTERELADFNGLYRCYDSGKLRFVKDIVRD